MAGQINIGDTWKNTTSLQVNINDTWKAVTGGYINIGDTWKQWWPDAPVIPTDDGKYMYMMKSDGNIIKSVDYGANWTNPTRTGTAYGDIYCNATGQYVNTTPDGYQGTYISSNYGVSFVAKAITAGGYQGAMSADGSIQHLGGGANKTFYSIDSGNTWNTVTMSLNGAYYGTACSANGSIVYHSGNNGVFKSINTGQTYVQMTGATNMRQCACSANGQYVTAVRNPGLVYVSSDFGVNFSQKLYSSGWYSAAMSLSGQYQMVGGESANILCYSTNYGSTWLTGSTGSNFYGVDCSGYGEKMLGGGWGQYSKLSANYGTTFSNTYTSGNYFGVAINKLQ